jgi:uncharacterized OB-fold protein
MGFCPSCRVEYLPEVTKCPDCGSKIVDELPDLPDVKWVALPELPGVVFAQMVVEVLEQEDIPAYIQSLWSSGAMGVITTTSMPGVTAKIFVPEPEYERAKQIQDSMMDQK